MDGSLREALQVLERIRPQIITPPARSAMVGYRTYVPHNQADLVSAAWDRGNLEESIASYRIEKDYRSTVMDSSENEIPALHYLYRLDRPEEECTKILSTIRPSVRSISALGWGIDLVAADANLRKQDENYFPDGIRWIETFRGVRRLRVQRGGSLESLAFRHERFLSRLVDRSFMPVPPLTAFDVVAYRREDEQPYRPIAVFELRNSDGTRTIYPHRQLIHIAGMVRHLAIEAMKDSPPPDAPDGWVASFIAGHKNEGRSDHQQISYLPLPSIGHPHTDPGIRRVMLMAPAGSERILDYVARHLAGRNLLPLGGEFSHREPPLLVPLSRKAVEDDPAACRYAGVSRIWSSFTPVILPGHDDHKPEKRKALIEKALLQSGIDQKCEYEVSEHSQFRKSYSAHKYDKAGKPQGYIRPNHLLSQTAIHLTLRFQAPFKGPLCIGAGRHCGLGLFAPAEGSSAR